MITKEQAKALASLFYNLNKDNFFTYEMAACMFHVLDGVSSLKADDNIIEKIYKAFIVIGKIEEVARFFNYSVKREEIVDTLVFKCSKDPIISMIAKYEFGLYGRTHNGFLLYQADLIAKGETLNADRIQELYKEYIKLLKSK